MDPFEVRLEFVGLLTRLTSSVPSITKVTSFALKHGPRCGDDIWDCLVDECGTMSLNQRINLMYLLDSLLDKQQSSTAIDQSSISTSPYKDLIKRDLHKIIELVVPDTREGVLNLMSAEQVLKSWRTRRLLDSDILDESLSRLHHRRQVLHESALNGQDTDSATFSSFTRQDILRRIEDDRERHKRLRERIWVLPVPSTLRTIPSKHQRQQSTSNATMQASTTSTGPSPISPASPSEFGPTSKKSSSAKSKVTVSQKAAHQQLGSAQASNQQRDKASMPPPPVPGTTASGAGAGAGSLDNLPRGPEHAIEIEFEQLWDASEQEMRDAFASDDDDDDDDSVLPVRANDDRLGQARQEDSLARHPGSLDNAANKAARAGPASLMMMEEGEELEEGEEAEPAGATRAPSDQTVHLAPASTPLITAAAAPAPSDSRPSPSSPSLAAPAPPARPKRERARRNSRGGWELDEAELAAMRQERRRCFA